VTFCAEAGEETDNRKIPTSAAWKNLRHAFDMRALDATEAQKLVQQIEAGGVVFE
jgi:hypothetical protein